MLLIESKSCRILNKDRLDQTASGLKQDMFISAHMYVVTRCNLSESLFPGKLGKVTLSIASRISQAA